MTVTMNQIEVKKTVFVTIEGTEKRAKVLAKSEGDTISVQLYDGNKLQKNEDKTPIATTVSLDVVSLEKTSKAKSKTNLYNVTVVTVVDEKEEIETLLSEVSHKVAMAKYKEYDEKVGSTINLVKTYDSKANSSEIAVMKTRIVGEEVSKPKAVKAVYGISVKAKDADEATMTKDGLGRNDALAAYKEAKEAGNEGDTITMVTISDTTGKVVNKATYSPFVVGSATQEKKSNQWGVNVNGETKVSGLSYNETRKSFTALKNDENHVEGTVIEMLKLVDTEGKEVNEVKFTHTVEVAPENAEPLPQPSSNSETEIETESEKDTDDFNFELEEAV